MSNYIEDKTFEKIDGIKTPIDIAEYEHCDFINCNFSEANLSGAVFSSCKFKDCNLSMAVLAKTSFRNVQFVNCKMLGLRFENCNDFLFEIHVDSCTHNLSSFYKLKLKKMRLKNCTLHEVDFTEADLSASTFDNCDLLNASFDKTILEKADFRTSYNYIIDPENNRIKKAKFSRNGIAGLLNKYDIEIE
jgi:fluoroquinolone resistance protein